MKRKVAISLDSFLLGEIDRMSQTSGSKRSSTIEVLLKKQLGMKRLDTAILLAGGKGTRLRPITYEIPKPLVPVRGRPAISWQIEMLKGAGIDNIILSIGHGADKIRHAIRDDGVTFIEEKQPMGTGGALNLAEGLVKGSFLVMNSDTLFMPYPNIAGMYEFHIRNRITATILVLMKDDVSSYGMIRLAEDSRVISFSEKPKSPQRGLISAGMYIFTREIFDFIEPKCSIENDVFPNLVGAGKLNGYFFDGRTFDIGTIERYEDAIKKWKPS